MGFAEGRQKWEARMQTADAKYQSKKGEMAANYNSGLTAAGVAPGPLTQAAYQRGIANASLRNVQGKGAKWETNTRAGISR